MKIYGRKQFLLGFVCGLLALFEYKHYAGATSVIWIVFFLYLGVRLIWTACFKDLRE